MRRLLFILVPAFSVLTTTPGHALPRDDAMSSAFHCAVIADSRQWLDCYYGAAQPIRAQLGMLPALTSQVHLAQSPPRGKEPADVPIRNEVMGSVSNCYSIADDRQWLSCYYGATQPMRTRLGLAPMPQASAAQQVRVSTPSANVSISPTAPIEHQEGSRRTPNSVGNSEGALQQFGLVSSQPPMAHKTDHIVARMAAYRFDQYGIFTVTLANGQIWQQVAGDTDYAHWKKQASGYMVNISHGFIGSYNLRVEGIAGSYKVRRTK